MEDDRLLVRMSKRGFGEDDGEIQAHEAKSYYRRSDLGGRAQSDSKLGIAS